MRFRIHNKRENYHINDCEYLVNHKGEIFFNYTDKHGGIYLIPCPTQYIIQYSTGLTDISGQEIFEGDLVCWEEANGETREATVIFSPKLAQFVLDTSGRHLIDDKYGDYRPMHYQEGYKIIKK